MIFFNDYGFYEITEGIGFGTNGAGGYIYGVSENNVFDGNATNLLDENWHHLVVIFKKGDIQGSKIYVDTKKYDMSALQSIYNASDDTFASFQNGIHFNPALFQDGNYGCTNMDHIRIYKRELNQNEINALYLYDGNGLWNLNEDNGAVYSYTNIGIGTAYPETKLDVEGIIQGDGFQLSCVQGEVSGGLYCHNELDTGSTDNSPHLQAKEGKTLMFSTDERSDPDVEIDLDGILRANKGAEVTNFLRLTPMEGCIMRENCSEDAHVGRLCYYHDSDAEQDTTYTSHADTSWFADRVTVRLTKYHNNIDPANSDIQEGSTTTTLNLDPAERLEVFSDEEDNILKLSTIRTPNGHKDTIELKTKIDETEIPWTESRKKEEWRRWNTTSGFYGCTKRVDRYKNISNEYYLEIAYEWRRLDLIGKENQSLFTEIYDQNFEHGIGDDGGGLEIVAENWACSNMMEQGQQGWFIHKCTTLDGGSASRYLGVCIGHIGDVTMARCSTSPYNGPGFILSTDTQACGFPDTPTYNHVCTALDVSNGHYGCTAAGDRMLCDCDNLDPTATGIKKIEDIDYNY
jgi:hypothetical protein